MVATGQTKTGRDRQLHKLMDVLGQSRERVFQESQKLTNFDIPNDVWNAHVAAMREFYDGIDKVYNDAARMLHIK